MEVLLGFAAGYLIGTRHGRDGLANLLGTAREIRDSPQTRQLLGEGLSAVAPISKAIMKGRGDTRVAAIRDVLEEIAGRRTAQAA
jgi:hypothetical protein